jgi:hypothetical protein
MPQLNCYVNIMLECGGSYEVMMGIMEGIMFVLWITNLSHKLHAGEQKHPKSATNGGQTPTNGVRYKEDSRKVCVFLESSDYSSI